MAEIPKAWNEEQNDEEIFFSVDKDNNPDVHVFIEIFNPHEKISVYAPEFDEPFTIRYLPPVTMRCTFPKEYPHESPPIVRIISPWMNRDIEARAQNHLHGLYNQEPGLPVVYNWFNWVKNSIWDELSLGRDFRLEEGMIVQVMEYNKRTYMEKFKASEQICEVCFDSKIGSEFFWVDSCMHAFCKDCLIGHCKASIDSGAVYRVSCLSFKCGSLLTPAMVSPFVHPTIVERWEYLLLTRAIDSIGNPVECIRCKEITLKEDEHPLMMCPKCLFAFCTECKQKWHGDGVCPVLHGSSSGEYKNLNDITREKAEAERQRMAYLIEKQKREQRELLRLSIEERKQRLIEQQKLEHKEFMESIKNMKKYEVYSAAVLLKATAKCPNCRMRVHKTEGCDHITCICGAHFCYLCSQVIDGYRHFAGECEGANQSFKIQIEVFLPEENPADHT